jgi:hypothetical protein
MSVSREELLERSRAGIATILDGRPEDEAPSIEQP